MTSSNYQKTPGTLPFHAIDRLCFSIASSLGVGSPLRRPRRLASSVPWVNRPSQASCSPPFLVYLERPKPFLQRGGSLWPFQPPPVLRREQSLVRCFHWWVVYVLCGGFCQRKKGVLPSRSASVDSASASRPNRPAPTSQDGDHGSSQLAGRELVSAQQQGIQENHQEPTVKWSGFRASRGGRRGGTCVCVCPL